MRNDAVHVGSQRCFKANEAVFDHHTPSKRKTKIQYSQGLHAMALTLLPNCDVTLFSQSRVLRLNISNVEN